MECRAALGDVGAGLGRAYSEGAVVVGDASPPVDGVDIVVPEGEEGNDAHEARAGVEGGGHHIGVASPPLLVVLEHPVVEEEADGEPAVVVDGLDRGHSAGGPEDDGEADERDPLLLRVEAVEDVDDGGTDEAEDEEVVQAGVGGAGPEHPARTDHAPDDRGAEEHRIAGASPRGVVRQQVGLADVGDVGEQPPRRPEVARVGDHRTHQLKQKSS